MNHSLRILLAGAIAFTAAVVTGQTPDSHYRVVNRIHVDGDGFWDLLAADTATGRIFLSHATMVQVVEAATGAGPDAATYDAFSHAKTGAVLDSFPIGDHADGAAFDPVFKRAYASCGDGTLAVIQEDKSGSCKFLETVATQKGARTIAIDEKTHHLFLPTADFGPPPSPTTENPRPRPAIKPGTFVVLDIETVK
jgi:hypothetical protein